MIKKTACKPLCAILVAGAMLIGLAGCGGDEGDIASPDLTIDPLFSQNENTTGTLALKVVSADLDLKGTVEEGASVEVEVNSNEPVAVSPVGGTWKYVLANADLVEGFNTISIAAEDVVGNRTSLTFLVEKDTTGPVVTREQFVSSAPVGDQTIGGTVEIGSTVEVLVNAVVVGMADVQGTVWEAFVSGLSDGDKVSVLATDSLGNQGDEISLVVKIAPSLPDLTVLEPSIADLEGLRETGTLTLKGSRAADAIVSVGLISPVGGDSQPVVEEPLLDATGWQVILSNLPAGNTVLEITAENAGGISVASELVVRDLIGPSVIANSPGHGQVVDKDALPPITVTFSEDMKDDVLISVDAPSMTLTAHDDTVVDGDTAVEGVVTYDPVLRTATFTPTLSLTANKLHTATVSSGVTDALGNAMGATYSWQFTTAP